MWKSFALELHGEWSSLPPHPISRNFGSGPSVLLSCVI